MTPLQTRSSRLCLPSRPSKRRRLSPTSPLSALPNGAFPFGNLGPVRTKRTRSGTLHTAPSTMNKRRRSTPPSPVREAQLRSAKRLRRTHEDVEMADVPDNPDAANPGAPRKRKTLLRDILRAEKVTRAMWRDVLIHRARSSAETASAAPGVDTSEPSATSEMGPRSASVEGVTRLTGEEEVCEVVDASENTDPNPNFGAGYTHTTRSGRTRVEPSVQAVLMEDGLCAVQIVRGDGSTQSVIIQPPDGNYDAW